MRNHIDIVKQLVEPKALLEVIDIRSGQFRKWFAGSKVVDANGKPLICYHGTHANKVFEPGKSTHFGTYQAANDRINYMYQLIATNAASPHYDSSHVSTPHIYPVYLSIKNPLEMEDSELQDADVIMFLYTEGRIDDETMEEFQNGESNIGWEELVVNLGYDGIKYKNEMEDVGSISWMPLVSGRVWNIFSDHPY